jgi:hypothetical protein
VGFYFDQKYMLSIGDTTYVYDERAKAWSTWDLTFAGATLYGTEDELNFLPGDSMYFIKSGDSVLYRYGTSEQDNGTAFDVKWQSAPMFADIPKYKQITAVEVAFNSGDDNDTLWAYLFDETGTQITGIAPGGNPNTLVFDTLSDRYRLIEVLAHPPKRYYQIELRNNGVKANSDAVIDLIDIWFTEGMKPLGN